MLHYDSVGNRTQRSSTLPAIPATGLLNYDANDRTSTDPYDSNGNLLNGGVGSNVYDFENHMVAAGGVSLVYDGDGNRVKETVAGVATSYLVADQNLTGYAQVMDELQSGAVSHTYSYGLSMINERQSIAGASTTSFYGYDGHGSVRFLTSSTGAITDTYDYDAFGSLISQTGATPNNYLFAGEQFDPLLGIYYNRARYYDQRQGRFWTMDTWEGDPQSPVSLHKYLYAGADPINNIDRSGNDFSLAGITITTGIQTTIFGLGTLASKLVISAVVGALFASSFAGIGAALEGKTPDEIESATGNPYNIALGAILGAAGGYATAFRLGRAIFALASLGGGGWSSYKAYKDGHIAASIYYGALAIGGAFLSLQANYILGRGPIPSVTPTSLGEQLALEEAAANGRVVMANLGDAPRLEAVYGDGTWVKMEWTHRIPSGTIIQPVEGGPTIVPPPQNLTIHFFKNIDTGEVVEFKFK